MLKVSDVLKGVRELSRRPLLRWLPDVCEREGVKKWNLSRTR
jgi:hypothetical protein